jgi:Transaldolase/Fructose-6-phosphate aldolase
MVQMSRGPLIKGFTTNPSLMRKAGVSDYEAFARRILAAIPDRPVSFEVFADDFASMAEQARMIAAGGPNVNVKVPVTNTNAQSATELIRALSSEGVTLNVTAIFTLDQMRTVADALDPAATAIISVFAGRIADTGIDPIPHRARGQASPYRASEGTIALGEQPRALEHFSRRGEGLRHRYGAKRIAKQAQSHRQGLYRIFARDGGGLFSRCRSCCLSNQDDPLCRGVSVRRRRFSGSGSRLIA